MLVITLKIYILNNNNILLFTTRCFFFVERSWILLRRASEELTVNFQKKLLTLLDLCVSSLRRDHATQKTATLKCTHPVRRASYVACNGGPKKM